MGLFGIGGSSQPAAPAALPTSPPPPESINPDGRDEDFEPKARFLAYAMRVGRLLGSSVRYTAYSSDIGEAFRPIAPPIFVKSMYALSFSYVGGEIVYNGYRASEEGRSVERALAHATVFQGLASLAVPFAIIHTQVSATAKLCTALGAKSAIRYAPTLSGLAWLPVLPTLVDEPIEELVHEAFHTYWPEEHPSGHAATAKAAVADVKHEAEGLVATLKKFA